MNEIARPAAAPSGSHVVRVALFEYPTKIAAKSMGHHDIEIPNAAKWDDIERKGDRRLAASGRGQFDSAAIEILSRVDDRRNPAAPASESLPES